MNVSGTIDEVKTIEGAIANARRSPKNNSASWEELGQRVTFVVNTGIATGVLELYYQDGKVGVRPTGLATLEESADVIAKAAQLAQAKRQADELYNDLTQENDSIGG